MEQTTLYTVRIYKEIFACDSPIEGGHGSDSEAVEQILQQHPDGVCLEYELTLPFAPFPGLEIQDFDYPNETFFRSSPLLTVKWINERQVFHCYTRADNPPFQNASGQWTYEKLIARAISQGWTTTNHQEAPQ
jgi:hypothetical protein